MAWEADMVYLKGLDLFSSVVDRFPPDAWDRPSPCAGWRALDVLGHVGATTRYGVALLAGEAPDWAPPERPGDSVEGEPAAWWAGLAARAGLLTKDADMSRVVETPAGARRVEEGIRFPALDLFVHAWDLGRSAEIDVAVPPEVVDFTHSTLDRLPEAQLRGPGVFAAEVTAPAGATPTETFIAWTGRDPRWSAA
jgi:uncharacterized protein (TIGR03086 family)